MFFSNCLQDTAVVVELKGVEYMNDDPADVDVLYAKVVIKDGSNRYKLFKRYHVAVVYKDREGMLPIHVAIIH